MGRGRDEHPMDTPPAPRPARRHESPIPLDPVSVLAGIAPGVELTVDPLPAGVAGALEDTRVTVSVEEVGRLLRCGEGTVRRLIRTAVLRPVRVDGAIHVRRSDVDTYLKHAASRVRGKPGE
ncbi:MAG: helix-turn-helix domain-containing protein [bacterium]|nr:helix-turn-helix domain-containing protein [bacterium]